MDFCVLCTRHFATNAALKQHERDSLMHKKTFHCQSCNSYFLSKAALTHHERDSPIHKKTFHCQNCDTSFGSNKTLKNHRKLCQAVSGRPQDPGRLQDAVDTPLYQGRDEGMSINTRPRAPTIDPQSSMVEQFAQMLLSAFPPTRTTNSQRPRNGVPQPTQETRKFFTFPELHPNIADAVSPEISSTWFNGDDDDDDDFDDEWLTHVMGKFTCTNKTCKKRFWGSKKVSIEIRGYDDNGYSAVVYNQSCKSCDELGTFELDIPSYVERVAYRLKKWAGVEMKAPPFNEIQGPPHEQAYCEGCKRGKCREGDRVKLY
jgi:transcription elongation factor Elf1